MNVQSRIRIGLVGAVALTVGACAVEPGDAVPGPLEGRRSFAAMQAGDVHFAATHDGAAMPALAPAVTNGQVVVRVTDERVVLEELVVELADLDVTKQVGTTTQVLHLTDLRLRLGTQADAPATWIDATQVSGAAPADLLLDWSLRARDGSVFPLATQRVRAALDVHLAIDAVHGDAIASVTSTAPGLVWELGDITVSDLSLALVTAESGDMP